MSGVRIWFWRAVSALGSLLFITWFFPLYGTLSAGQIFGAALILAVAGYGTDRVVLSRWNGWAAAVVDFFLAWAVAYGMPAVFPGTPMTATFAVLCGWMFAFAELVVHNRVYRKEDWEGPDRAEARQPGP